MNLMDMLAGGDSPYDPLVQLQSDDADDISSNNQSPQNNIFYFPVQLTTIQRELKEIVLRMYHEEISLICKEKQRRTSILNLVDETTSLGVAQFLNFDKVRSLVEHLMTIDKHPSLLVDHFIPRKLILSEINERVLTLSAKLQLLDHIVENLISGLRRNQLSGYHMLLVAQSAREIELVEGLLIGKDLYYQNLSSSKLYDDKRGVPANLQGRLVIYMITLSQLYNNYIPETITTPTPEVEDDDSLLRLRQPPPVKHHHGSRFNLIMSLDIKLDPLSPSLEFLRPEGHKTPMVLPVPTFSIEHIIIQNPEPLLSLSESHFQWQVQIIEALIMNLEHDVPNDNFYLDNYGANFNKVMPYLLHWHESEIRLACMMSPFNQRLSMGFSTQAMLGKLTTLVERGLLLEEEVENHAHRTMVLPLTQFDYELFKLGLAEILNTKLSNLKTWISNVQSTVLQELRYQETKRQLEFDADEDEIASKFKKLRKLQEDATTAEHKQARVEGYFTKYSQSSHEWNAKISFLRLATHQQEDVLKKDVITGQLAKIAKLQEEMGVLTSTLTGLDQEYENIRTEYQQSLAEAVQLSLALTTAKEELTALTTKAGGPGSVQLPAYIRKDTFLMAEAKLQKCASDNKFIQGFIDSRIDRIIVERQEKDQVMNGGRRSRQGTPM